jgi:hypothetical protein
VRESAIEHHLVVRVRKIGGECFKFTSPGRLGVPDRIVVLPGGEVIWIELKAWLGTLSPVQVRMHARLLALEQDVQVFRSVDQIDKYFPLET